MSEPIFPHSFDSIFAASSVGSLDRALANNIYGLNNTRLPGFSASNKDNQGFIFMTRPQLNLQKMNIRNTRELYPLLNEDNGSLAKAIRMYLDPRIGAGYTLQRSGKSYSVPPDKCSLVDNEQAFIPWITNNTMSSSGWPDMRLNTSTSDPGLHKQVSVLPDGVVRNYTEYDLTLNIENTKGDPVTLMSYVWLHYMAAVKEGRLQPYFDYLMHNRRDFDTRIYRVILDQNQESVTKIMASVAGFPVNCPLGMFGDFNRNTPFSEQTKEISLNIKCTGFVGIDPLLIQHFNHTVEAFCPGMNDQNRGGAMVLLTKREYPIFRHRCYPRIDPANMEFQWWTRREIYDKGESNLPLTIDRVPPSNRTTN